MKRLQHTCEVVSNKKICGKFFRLCLGADSIVKTVRPGQFIHIRVNNGLSPLFRRPFSVYRAQKHVEILYEVVGQGTKALSSKKAGEKLDVLGPLGNEFSMPPGGTEQVVMIAGGVGVAPFLILSDALKNRGYEMVLLYGGRTKGHVYEMTEFKKNRCNVHISTDDGSKGKKGRVSTLFSKIDKKKKTFLYTCGPKPMMASVWSLARSHHLEGQACCEEVMACGLGACLGCSILTKSGYKTVCYDGPVFDLQELIFNE